MPQLTRIYPDNFGVIPQNNAVMNVTIRFNSVFDLWQFKQVVQATVVEILTKELVMIGDFEEAEVELAQRGFKAEVVRDNQSQLIN